MHASSSGEPFDAFYEATFERLVFGLRRTVRDDAEDVAQEAMLVARARWEEVRSLDRPETWVRHVAMRIATRRMWRERARAGLEAHSNAPPQDPAPDLDLAAALLGLSDRHAAAVRLHHLRDRPVVEVADALGCTPGAAKVLLFRARRVLAERLIGLTGEWVSDRTWTPDAIVRHLVDADAPEAVGPVLEDLGGRGGRFTLRFLDGAYELRRDDGARFDHGRSRVLADTLEMAPILARGRERYRVRVDGSRLTLRLIDTDLPPTRGIQDAVWTGFFLEATHFVRAGGPARRT